MPDVVYECVPNFSVGPRSPALALLQAAIREAGASVLDVHADPVYHRTVMTFMDNPPRVTQAAFNAIAVAARTVDMTRHRGAHPRLGATDVCPFIALQGTAEERCVADVRQLARRVARQLDLCVYLYGQAALRPPRRVLSDLRRGEFERWYAEIGRDPRWQPDFGPARPRKCGPVVLGVRPVLIAVNFVLDADALALARSLARRIRSRGGGLPAVQARGFRIGDRAHVSCNLLDYRRTRPVQVFQAVQALARPAGVAVQATEIVGLMPRAAASASDLKAMKVAAWSEKRWIEYWLPGS